jgi:hypothetical protein
MAPTWARDRGVALLDGEPDERDHARERDRRPSDHRGDREGLRRITGQRQKNDAGDRSQTTQRE